MINAPKWVDIDVIGEHTKQKYFGRFALKPYLTNGERADAVRLSETYFRGISENTNQKMFLSALAFLSMHIVETDAKWWTSNGLDLLDEAPVWAIINKLSEIQDPNFGKPKDPTTE
jgi:hypothetical protein